MREIVFWLKMSFACIIVLCGMDFFHSNWSGELQTRIEALEADRD